MARVAHKDSAPELLVRKAAHQIGLRFRLHRKDLPGTPDVIFPSRRVAVFVHGCFWHRHRGCRRATEPQARADYWRAKFQRNVARDREAKDALEKLGWHVITIWECEIYDPEKLAERLEEISSQPHAIS
jgi:DNA mismatch endonuclease (patch repair protein)